MKTTKNLDAKPVDPNHAIRLQIKAEIERAGGHATIDEVFAWVEERTKLDLHDPANFPAILVALKALPSVDQKPVESSKAAETSPNPPKPTPETPQGGAIIEEVDQLAAPPASPSQKQTTYEELAYPKPTPSPAPDSESDKSAINFDRALAPKAGERYLHLFKTLLLQKQAVPVDALSDQLDYLVAIHGIKIEKLEDLTHDEAKDIIEKLTKQKVENQSAPETVADKEPSNEQVRV